MQVLHRVAGQPLISHTVSIVIGRGWSPLVIVVSPSNATAVKNVRVLGNVEAVVLPRAVYGNLLYLQAISQRFPDACITYKEQAEAKGVLHATEVGLSGLDSFEGNVLVIPGNMPLLQPDATLLCLEAMIAEGTGGAQVRLSVPSQKLYPHFAWIEFAAQCTYASP